MTVIKVKNSNVAGRIPAAGDLQPAELAINLQDKKLYSKDVSGQVFEIGVAGDVPTGNTPPSTGNNNGDLFFDTTSNELKYWSGTAWETVTVEPADGEGYVKVSGDTMTGQLGLPGGGTGAEAIQVQEAEQLITDIGIGDYVSKTDTASQNIASDVTIGDDKIKLNANGGAEFAGDLRLGDVGGAGTFTFINGAGNVTVRTNQPNAIVVEDFDADSPDQTISLNTNGSAEFAGRISGNGECFLGDNNLDPRGYLKIINNSTNADDDAIRITDTTNNNVVEIKVDGTAEFAGSVQSGPYVANELGTIYGCYMDPEGTYYSNVGPEDAYNWVARRNGTVYSVIKADGSAEFSGDVYARNQFRTQNFYGVADSAVLGVVVAGADGTPNASIAYDGTAEFAGIVRSTDDSRFVGGLGTGLWFTSESVIPTISDDVGNATNGEKDLRLKLLQLSPTRRIKLTPSFLSSCLFQSTR